MGQSLGDVWKVFDEKIEKTNHSFRVGLFLNLNFSGLESYSNILQADTSKKDHWWKLFWQL